MAEHRPAETTVLVTGASGFIGLHCVRELLQNGYRVRATARLEVECAQPSARGSSRHYSPTLALSLALAVAHARRGEPEGRSPAQRAAKRKRKRSARREDYGWGWAGGVTNSDAAAS